MRLHGSGPAAGSPQWQGKPYLCHAHPVATASPAQPSPLFTHPAIVSWQGGDRRLGLRRLLLLHHLPLLVVCLLPFLLLGKRAPGEESMERRHAECEFCCERGTAAQRAAAALQGAGAAAARDALLSFSPRNRIPRQAARSLPPWLPPQRAAAAPVEQQLQQQRQPPAAAQAAPAAAPRRRARRRRRSCRCDRKCRGEARHLTWPPVGGNREGGAKKRPKQGRGGRTDSTRQTGGRQSNQRAACRQQWWMHLRTASSTTDRYRPAARPGSPAAPAAAPGLARWRRWGAALGRWCWCSPGPVPPRNCLHHLPQQ